MEPYVDKDAERWERFHADHGHRVGPDHRERAEFIPSCGEEFDALLYLLWALASVEKVRISDEWINEIRTSYGRGGFAKLIEHDLTKIEKLPAT